MARQERLYDAALRDIAKYAVEKFAEVAAKGGVRDVSAVMGHCMDALQSAREIGAELPDEIKELEEVCLRRLGHFAELAEASLEAEEASEPELDAVSAVDEVSRMLGL